MGGIEKCKVSAQDTCFTILGQPFQRIIIDKILDCRFDETLELHRSNSYNPRLSIEAQLLTNHEYNLNNCSHILYLQDLLRQCQLENEYNKKITDVERFNNTFIFMKGTEDDYGNRCKQLCQNIEDVFMIIYIVSK